MTIGVMAGGAGSNARSLKFVRASSQYLDLSNANWGSYTRTKFSIVITLKRASTGASMILYRKGGALTNNREFEITLTGGDKVQFLGADGTGTIGNRITTSSFTSTSEFYNFVFHYDSANATANDRMKLFEGVTQITDFSTLTNPSGAVGTTTEALNACSNASGGSTFDGLISRIAFFDNVLVNPSDTWNETTGKEKDITGISGLKSLISAQDGVTVDSPLGESWTNNNGVTIVFDGA